MAGMTLSEADVAYVRSNYFTLEELCGGRETGPDEVRELIASGTLPAPSYVLPDGTEMFPADYFVLVDQAGGPEALRREFDRRHPCRLRESGRARGGLVRLHGPHLRY